MSLLVGVLLISVELVSSCRHDSEYGGLKYAFLGNAFSLVAKNMD